VQPAEHDVAVEQRVQLHALVGAHHPGLDAPRGEPAAAAVQLGEPLRGERDLQPTDLQVAGLPVQLERAELLDGVAGQLGHGLGRVGLEHQPRRV
jgi:hypothetical protein